MTDIVPKKSFQFILKPCIACNLACEYCYAAHMRRDAHSVMTIREAKTAVSWALRFCQFYGIGRVSFLWQGGEPLLVGAQFIDEIATYYEEIFAERGIQCSSLLQTNLLLMNDEIVSVIKRHFRGRVGFSYDYGSSTRIYADGRNAADDIWEKAKWCREQDLSIGAICQITSENIGHMKDLYETFSNHGIHFKISQIFPSQGSVSKNAGLIPPDVSARAVCEVFDFWFHDKNPRIEISNLRELMSALLRGRSNECCRQNDCAALLLALIPAGRIFPCARFDRDEDVIGNYYHDEPKDVFESRLLHRNGNMKTDTKCDMCKYKEICNGGCYYNRITGWHEAECVSNQIVISHIEKRLSEHGLSFGCMKEEV